MVFNRRATRLAGMGRPPNVAVVSRRALSTARRLSSRLTLWPKRLLYVACACGVLVVGGRLPTWALVLLLLPIAVAEGALRWVVARRFPLFERRLLGSIRAGATGAELLALYQGERLLRFAAPRHRMLGALALIHASLGQHDQAARAYRGALDDAPARASLPLVLGLADTLYETGEDAEAERLYRLCAAERTIAAQAHANLARLIRKRGGDAAEAERYFRSALDEGRGGGRVRCELVQLLVQQGRIEDARWELQLAAEELAGGAEADREALRNAEWGVRNAESEDGEQEGGTEAT